MIINTLLIEDLHNEPELLLRLANGDQGAMRSVFNVYYPKLCVFANSVIDNIEESRDIAQVALIQLWNQRAQFLGQKEGNLAAYLFTVVRRDCYDYLKHQQVKRVKQKDIIGQTQIAEEGADSHMVYLEVLRKIYLEIESLPSNLAEIVRLSFIDGLTVSEISERLQITPNNVRVLKSRALEKLKNALLKRDLLVSSPLFLFFLENFLSKL